MRPDDALRVQHILQEEARISRWLSNRTYKAFLADDLLQAGVSHALQIVGEAAWSLTDEFRAQLPHIPWRQIAAMRHRLVHDYFEIDLRIVWEAATIHVQEFVRELQPFAPAEEE
jgi:uncharacterized protein with HEPN domain